MSAYIDIRIKLRSMLRRDQKFHCLCYDWETKQICVIKTEDQYRKQLDGLRDAGMVKRAQCYSDQIYFLHSKQNFLFYLISFGDFRKGKIVRGQNPIAKGLGICMFDFVYVFLDDAKKAHKKIEERVQKLDRRGQIFQRNLMLNVYHKFFAENQQNTAITLNENAINQQICYQKQFTF